jgi:hypothetical protein
MTVHALSEVINADPFAPFMLRLADGRSLHIDNPNLVAFLGTGRTLFVAHPRSERFELIDLLLIQSIIIDARGKGGQRRRTA